MNFLNAAAHKRIKTHGHFLRSAMELVEKWSAVRNPETVNCVKYALFRSPSSKIWTAAYQWASANKKFLQNDNDVQTYYTTSTMNKQEVNLKLLRKLKKKKGHERRSTLFTVI